MSQNQVIETIDRFCQTKIVDFLNTHAESLPYPKQIINDLAELGIFGINIPSEYGGSKLSISLNLEINRILSKYWLSIPALYGTHLRSNQYLIEIGTKEQKDTLLPKMADGSIIFAHAFHEKGKKNPLSFSTILKDDGQSFVLNGQKEWVTNAENSDRIIVVARNEEATECYAVMISGSDPGVTILKNYARRGIEGVSLNRLVFSNVKIEPYQIIGGPGKDASNFISDFRAISSLNFSARCVGISESITEQVAVYLMPSERDEVSLPVIANRWSELQMINKSIVAYFESSVNQYRNGELSKSDAHRTKVFCSMKLQEVVSKAQMLTGGTGYASDDHQLIRRLNDAGSLALIDTPNDTLLTWSGLNDFDDLQ